MPHAKGPQRHLGASGLPDVIVAYFAARRVRDAAGALRCFTPDAFVVAFSLPFMNNLEIARYLGSAAHEHTFSLEIVDGTEIASGVWQVSGRMGHDSSAVAVCYVFCLTDGLINALTIEA